MKLNEENGLKLEIKRSEINALIEEGLKMYNELDYIKHEGIVDNILNILPSDKSIGIVYSAEALYQKIKSSVIICFLKMAKYPDNDIEIHEQGWIIEEDES